MDSAELQKLISSRDVDTLRALLREAVEWPDVHILMIALEIATLPQPRDPEETK